MFCVTSNIHQAIGDLEFTEKKTYLLTQCKNDYVEFLSLKIIIRNLFFDSFL